MNKFLTIVSLLIFNSVLFSQNTDSNYLNFYGNKYYIGSMKNVGLEIISVDPSKKHHPNFYTGKPIYKLSGKVFNKVLDSLHIQSLTNGIFKISDGLKNYKIIGFTIFADSLAKEIKYSFPADLAGEKEDSASAGKQLINIISKLNNCHKFVLTDINYFDRRRNFLCRLDFEILLIK